MPTEKSLPTHATELWELVVAYLKQETIDPIKELGRFVGRGVLGSAALCIGLPLIALAVLRAVQSETSDHLTGNWSWAPYLIAAAVCLVFIGLAGLGISRTKKRRAKAARAAREAR
jgi:hypothetical protein